MYRVRASSRAVFITRNGATIQLESGQPFTQDEFKTIKSEAEVVCIDESNGMTYTVAVGAQAKPQVAAPVTTPEPAAEETPDQGVVPSSVETGSEDSQA